MGNKNKLTRSKTVEDVRYFKVSDDPVFVVTLNTQKFCHSRIEEQDEDDNIVTVKMRPTEPFLLALNKRVFDLLLEGIESARQDSRTTLIPQDIGVALQDIGLGDEEEAQKEADEE